MVVIERLFKRRDNQLIMSPSKIKKQVIPATIPLSTFVLITAFVELFLTLLLLWPKFADWPLPVTGAALPGVPPPLLLTAVPLFRVRFRACECWLWIWLLTADVVWGTGLVWRSPSTPSIGLWPRFPPFN